MFRRRRSWKLFTLFGILVGLLFVGLGIAILAADAPVAAGAALIVMGVALFVGAIAAFRTFANANAGKKDESINVRYAMHAGDRVQGLTGAATLKYELQNMGDGGEVLVELSPEYFGLMSWKFTRRKGHYISFVRMRKKDKVLEYFVMPNRDVDGAMAPFLKVFEGHEAVDTSILIAMKRFEAVCAYYQI